jgi:ABC-type Fe3+-hydroxamate transport system substrate-binding protein
MLNKIKALIVAVIVVAVSVVGAVIYLAGSGHDDDNHDTDAALKVYGNANGDHTIDSSDLDLISGIIAGDASFDEHPLADANYDGGITQADADLVQKIMNKENCTVYHINTCTAGDYVASTKWPVKSAIATGAANGLLFLTMAGVKDMIHGISYTSTSKPDPTLFPTFSAMPSLSTSSTEMGIEASTPIIKQYKVTALITDKTASTVQNEQEFENIGVDVIRIAPAMVDPNESRSQLLMIGFLFGTETQAMQVAEWQTNLQNYIDSKLEGVSKVTAITSNGNHKDNGAWISAGTSDYKDVLLAAGAIYGISDDTRPNKFGSGDYFAGGGTWLYNYDFEYLISIRTGGWYSGTVDAAAKYTESMQFLTHTEAYENGKAYVVVGDGPIPIRIAYCAAVMYPEIFSMHWANSINQEFFEKYYGEQVDLTGRFFVISPDMVSG